MFINIEDDYYLKYYSNLGEPENSILSPKEGLTIGNLFYNSYIPYKNYKPRELVARNEREQLLLKIQELCFAAGDLNLHLDLHPNDQQLFQLFRKHTMEANRLTDLYAEKYGPLELNQDIGANYSWYKNPWPWEVSDNV